MKFYLVPAPMEKPDCGVATVGELRAMLEHCRDAESCDGCSGYVDDRCVTMEKYLAWLDAIQSGGQKPD